MSRDARPSSRPTRRRRLRSGRSRGRMTRPVLSRSCSPPAVVSAASTPGAGPRDDSRYGSRFARPSRAGGPGTRLGVGGRSRAAAVVVGGHVLAFSLGSRAGRPRIVSPLPRRARPRRWPSAPHPIRPQPGRAPGFVDGCRHPARAERAGRRGGRSDRRHRCDHSLCSAAVETTPTPVPPGRARERFARRRGTYERAVPGGKRESRSGPRPGRRVGPRPIGPGPRARDTRRQSRERQRCEALAHRDPRG